VEKRNTIQKQLILNAVSELDIHATAEQVYEYVVVQYPTISKATVYRNLKDMAKVGELLNIGNFYGQTHYDHNLHDHHHFVCKNCKKVFDIEVDFADVYGKLKQFGFVIENVGFTGLCNECKQ